MEGRVSLEEKKMINKAAVAFLSFLVLCSICATSVNAMENSGEDIACTLYFNEKKVSDNSCHTVEEGDIITAGAATDWDRERYTVCIRSSKGLTKTDTPISEPGKEKAEFEATQSGRQYIRIAVTEIDTCRTTYFKLIVDVEDCEDEEGYSDERYDYNRRGDCQGERHRYW